MRLLTSAVSPLGGAYIMAHVCGLARYFAFSHCLAFADFLSFTLSTFKSQPRDLTIAFYFLFCVSTIRYEDCESSYCSEGYRLFCIEFVTLKLEISTTHSQGVKVHD